MTPVGTINGLSSVDTDYKGLVVGGTGVYGLWLTCASIVAVDVIALSTVYWIAVLTRYLLAPDYNLGFYLQLYPGACLFLLAFLMQGLYPGVLLHPAEEMRRVSYGVTSVFLLAGAATFLSRDAVFYSRSVFLLTWSVGVPAILLARTAARELLSTTDWWGIPTVILGSGPAARRVESRLGKRKLGLRVLGILGEDGSMESEMDRNNLIGPLESAAYLAESGAATYAIVALPELSTTQSRAIIQKHCRGFRHILLIPDIPYACSLGVTALDVGGELGIELPQRLFHQGAALTKRILDVSVALLGIMILSPLFILVSIAVKVSSSGPVFYHHPRHGLDGEVFNALKFRTMVVNGTELLNQYLCKYPDRRDKWEREHKLKDDPRVTVPGKWLRRLSLDELPQLFNVLFGQMSLVGPRPIVPNEVAQYGESFGFCTSVRPGITGLWQVSGRNDLAFEDRIHFNEYYIRNWSVWLDVYILFRTIRVVIGGRGAY